MKALLCGFLVIACLLTGCNIAKRPPIELVILPDVSASIDPESRRQMFAGIEEVVQHLRRGDTLIIIPITGDAEADLPGRILRYELPPVESRQAYDSDIRKINARVQGDLRQLAAAAAGRPGRHSDILGSIRVGLSEFSCCAVDRHLVVLSDFIQEDGQFNFRRDRPPINSASKLVPELSMGERYDSVQVSLGRLKSAEFNSLTASQRAAIDAFWKRILPRANSNPDGLELLDEQMVAL